MSRDHGQVGWQRSKVPKTESSMEQEEGVEP